MKHETLSIKCCDYIAPFNNYGRNETTERDDCLWRSVKVSQMIDSEINFGMVYFHNPIAAREWKNSHRGWCKKYGFHLWTEKEGNLYESCRQWDILNPKYVLNTDELVMVFDLSFHKRPNTLAQYKLIEKDVRKKLEFASFKGVKYVYFSGLVFSEYNSFGEFEWTDWDYTNGEIDLAEKRIEYFENGQEFILEEHL